MIILNETKEAKKILKTRNVGKKPTRTLFLLARYYRQKEHLSVRQTAQKLEEFMLENRQNYIYTSWTPTLEAITKKANKYDIREFESVGITQNELNRIAEGKNMKYQKLLFTMLCHAKFYNQISVRNNGWVNTGIPELYREARVSVRYKELKYVYLNDLKQAGFLSFASRNDNLNLHVDFIDADGEPVLWIEDFRELGYEYLYFTKNGNFIRCKTCGRLVPKTNNRCLYCKSCAKAAKVAQDRSYYIARKKAAQQRKSN